MARVAVVYDHLARPETTGVYCLRGLAELAQVELGVLHHRGA
jgi:hypothetical protein